LHFAHKNYGVIPDGEISDEIFKEIRTTINAVIDAMDQYEFKKAIDNILKLSGYGNSYFQSHEPWHLIKQDKKACSRIVKDCLQIAKALVLLSEPVLPVKMKEAWGHLGLNGDITQLNYDEALIEIESGRTLPKPNTLFEKIDDKKIKEMNIILNKRVAQASAKEASISPKTPEITFDEFKNMDIRVGTVITAQNIKGSEKLLKLMVDIGETGPRQVVAGIAQTHMPEELVGRQLILLANMKPAKIFGTESKGMILAADESGAVLLVPERSVKNGTAIR
jgi:methionyl-tRNA synthetase